MVTDKQRLDDLIAAAQRKRSELWLRMRDVYARTLGLGDGFDTLEFKNQKRVETEIREAAERWEDDDEVPGPRRTPSEIVGLVRQYHELGEQILDYLDEKHGVGRA